MSSTPDGTPGVSVSETELRLRDGQAMNVRWFKPEGDEASAGVFILLTDIFGWSDYYARLCAMFAADGLTVAAPDLFARVYPLPEITLDAAMERRTHIDDDTVFADIVELAEECRSEYGAIAAIGFCLGGTLGIRLSTLGTAATVAFYPWPAGDGGEPGNPPTSIELADQLTGPILAMWGADDQYIDKSHITRFEEALAAHEVEHEVLQYPEEGHGFIWKLFSQGGPTPGATDSYRRTVDLVRARLGGRRA